MPISLNVIKRENKLIPATLADVDLISKVKEGQALKVNCVRQSARSLEHNRLYWGGLIRLLSEYWETEDGFIPVYDKKILFGLIDWIASEGYETETMKTIVESYMTSRKESIRPQIQKIENQKNILNTIHDWIKTEVGLYDLVMTPTGPTKVLKSISFAKMDQDTFNDFYDQAFSVAWNHVFTKHNFKSQAEAERVALEMSRMG